MDMYGSYQVVERQLLLIWYHAYAGQRSISEETTTGVLINP
jgi:hypothetical protein